MVQLTTLPGWRQFTAATPSIPHLPAGQDRLWLEDGKRAVHDQERLEHHSRLVVVQTPVIERIVKRGGDLTRMNRVAHYGRSGLMVSGPARTGKTTAVTQPGKTAEVMHRHRHPHSGNDIPVIYLTVPPSATGKMIAMELARFPGLPVPRRANITGVIEPACGICLDTRVTMIIVGELHNLDMSTRAGAQASGTLKYFSERLPVTFAYAGTGLDRGALPAGPRGDQAGGRLTLIPAAAFTPGREWATLIAALEGALRLYRHKDGTLVTLADCLHRRTRGMTGSLPWLIRDAACQAILDGTEKITRKTPRPDRRRHDSAGATAPDRSAEAVTRMLPRDRAELIVAGYAAGKPARVIAGACGHSITTVRDYAHGRRALLEILPSWFRVKTRWHDDRCQPGRLLPWADDAAARLAVISGSARAAIKNALPAFGGMRGRPARAVIACRLCTAARRIQQPVPVHLPARHQVCPRHGIWLSGPGAP